MQQSVAPVGYCPRCFGGGTPKRKMRPSLDAFRWGEDSNQTAEKKVFSEPFEPRTREKDTRDYMARNVGEHQSAVMSKRFGKEASAGVVQALALGIVAQIRRFPNTCNTRCDSLVRFRASRPGRSMTS